MSLSESVYCRTPTQDKVDENEKSANELMDHGGEERKGRGIYIYDARHALQKCTKHDHGHLIYRIVYKLQFM